MKYFASDIKELEQIIELASRISKKVIVVLAGLPCSGKTTLTMKLQQKFDADIIPVDNLKIIKALQLLNINISGKLKANFATDSIPLFLAISHKILKERGENTLDLLKNLIKSSNKDTLIIDNTNATKETRKVILDIVKDDDSYVIAVEVFSDIEDIVKRNEKRSIITLSEDEIYDLYNKFEPIDDSEGFDLNVFFYNEEKKESILNKILSKLKSPCS